MKALAVLILLASSMAYGVDSVNSISADVDYCKASYKDSANGREGIYRGQCVNERPSGAGTVSFYNGDKIEGTFESGIMSGTGTYTSSQGDVYKGLWEDGVRHGKGTYNWARGSRYECEWIGDKRHGKGVFTWSNGNRFEGEFRNNKRYNGKYYTSSGRVLRCHLGQCK